MLTTIMPLLSDTDADVRRWAAIATASSARIFTGQSIDALLAAMGTAAPSDWGVFAAELGRIGMATPEVFARVEQTLASGLPPVVSSAQVVRPARRVARPADAAKIEGAARGLEALTRVSGKVAPLSAPMRVRGSTSWWRRPMRAARPPSPGRDGWRCRRCAMPAWWTAGWRARRRVTPTTKCGGWRWWRRAHR